MNGRFSRIRLLLRSALLVLLLSAQGSVLAHNLGHLDRHADNLCALCSAGSALESVSVDTSEPLAAPPARAPVPSTCTHLLVSNRSFHPQARAPPTTL